MQNLLKNTPLASKAWRICNLYTILDADGNLTKFIPNLAQRTYYNQKWYLDIILKARKLGFSTFIEIDHLDDILFGQDLTAGIIDYTLDDGKSKLAMMKRAYENLSNAAIHGSAIARLGAAIQKSVPLYSNSTQEIKWANGARAFTSTSLRGGTPQRLHISELGKTSIWSPIKAKEILNGAFNSITPGNSIKSESTHEGGKAGIHYNLLTRAMKKVGQHLTPVDMKFHFFPWYDDPRYELQDNLPLRPEIIKYFQDLEAKPELQGRTLSHAKKLWYDRKQEEQGHGMKKEFPSTPGEAFEAISDHAIYGTQMADLRSAGRIIDFGAEATYPLCTSWDIGLSDYTSIWLIQPVGRAILILDWMEHAGQAASAIADHITRWTHKWGRPIHTHYLPHDAETRDKGTGKSYRHTLIESGLKGDIVTVPRVPDIWLGIGYVRDLLPHCWFHRTHCDTPREFNGEEFPSGVACLEGYQRDISATGSTLKERPKHDLFSHSSDAFRTFAEAYHRGLPQSLSNTTTAKPRALR